MTTQQTISEYTGFDQGDEFTSEQQVREYFTVANLADMGLGGSDEGSERDNHVLTQDELDAMAAEVIRQRWHCAF